MNDEIKPALTPEEWAGTRVDRDDDLYAFLDGVPGDQWGDGWLHISTQGYEKLVVSPDQLHAVAALALHGQPFGFTAADLKTLRTALYVIGDDGFIRVNAANPRWAAEFHDAVISLMRRIDALLPPVTAANVGSSVEVK